MKTETDHIALRKGTRLDLPMIYALNKEIFDEDRLINDLDHGYLAVVIAQVDTIPVGFKIGYGLQSGIFYSAKGGVLPGWRRRGVARSMLRYMERIVFLDGYKELRYHTFPTRWPGMLSLGKSEGYDILESQWNATYNDYQLLMYKRL